MKIADRQNTSLSEVMGNYTDAEISLWRVYMQKEPDHNAMMQFLITQGLNMYYQNNYKKGGSTPDFNYPDLWKTEENRMIQRDNDIIRNALGAK